jgi:response regulator NasT
MRATIAERSLIERAKGVLMQRRRMSEAEAHHWLRRRAMDRGQRMVQVARDLLSDRKAE